MAEGSETEGQPSLPLAYRTLAPRQPSPPGKKPPLALLLHGVRSNELDLFSLAPNLPPQARIVSLRAPLVRGPESYAWFDVTFVPDGYRINPEQLDHSRSLVVDFATQAAAAFDGDPARIYLLGFSQGAILSLTVALTQPELVAGILPLAGRIPPEVRPWMVAPERLAGLPVFLAHGRFDTVIPFFWAEQARDYLQSVGAALIFMEYPTGHRIPPDMLANAVSWLDASLIAPRWRPSQPIP